MNTQAFFEFLARCAEADTAVVSTLRRSLSFDPGTFASAFPVVESFTRALSERDRRTVYLTAGLWASAQRRTSGPPIALAAAMERVARDSGSSSVESRFVALLDADTDEIVWRLRHAVALTSSLGLSIDWSELLNDLLHWESPTRYVQRKWARIYWQHAQPPEPGEPMTTSA